MRDILTSSKFKALVSVTAAAVMYFTPDNIDRIIEGLLAAFGISTLVIGDKKDDY
jgi:hypothetical protein